jgi:hypothetical protein
VRRRSPGFGKMLHVSVGFVCVWLGGRGEGREEGKEGTEQRVMFCESRCNRVNKKGGEAQGYIQYL